VSESRIAGVRACVFDAYGTLFDFASAARRCPSLPEAQSGPLTALWRHKQLQYSWLRSIQGRHADFWTVTQDALDFALAAYGLHENALRDRLMNLYLDLEPFADVVGVLARIKSAGLETAILSNGSPIMLRAAVDNAGIGNLIDAVLSAEQAGVFKPHPRVYQLAVECFRLERSALCFVSSNAWDACAAAEFGMRVVWCNRYGQPRERLPGTPDREIQSLSELPATLGIPGDH